MSSAVPKPPLLIHFVLAWTAIVFLVGVGVWWAFEGMKVGQRMALVNPEEARTLVIEGTAPGPRSYGSGARAYGMIVETGDRTDVAITAGQHKALAPGHRLPVYLLAPDRAQYVSRQEYEAAGPLLRLGDVVVTWQFPGGILLVLAMVAAARRAVAPTKLALGKDRRVAPR